MSKLLVAMFFVYGMVGLSLSVYTIKNMHILFLSNKLIGIFLILALTLVLMVDARRRMDINGAGD